MMTPTPDLAEGERLLAAYEDEIYPNRDYARWKFDNWIIGNGEDILRAAAALASESARLREALGEILPYAERCSIPRPSPKHISKQQFEDDLSSWLEAGDMHTKAIMRAQALLAEVSK